MGSSMTCTRALCENVQFTWVEFNPNHTITLIAITLILQSLNRML
jgi:hypothetical protein